MDDEQLRSLLEQVVSADDVTRVEFFPYIREQIRRSVQDLEAPDRATEVPASLYIASLLDRLGMPDEAELVTRAVALASLSDEAAMAQNWSGVLAASRGRLAEADRILQSLVEHSPESEASALAFVNLVAVNLYFGHFDKARHLIGKVRSEGIGTDDPRSDVLLAILEIQLERVSGSRASLADAVGQLRSIISGALSDPDLSGLDELTLLAHLALANFDVAKTGQSRREMLDAVDLATLVTQVLTATVGLQDRTAIVLRTRAALSEFEAACESRQPEMAAAAIVTLVDCHYFICAAFGDQDHRAVTLLANIAAARLEHARMVGSMASAMEAFEALEVISQQVSRVFGPTHPTAVAVVVNLASAAFDLARIADSEQRAHSAADLLESAVARSRVALGDRHPQVQIAQRELASCRALIRDTGYEGRAVAVRTRNRTRLQNSPGFGQEYISQEQAAALLFSPVRPKPPKGRQVVGTDGQLAKDIVRRYMSGESIRSLAASMGRSYGFVHRLLTESGVQLRQRGGARRRKKS